MPHKHETAPEADSPEISSAESPEVAEEPAAEDSPTVSENEASMPEETVQETENEAPMPEDEPVVELPEPIPQTAHYVLIKVDNLNVRTGAGTSYPTLGQVEKGTLLCLGGKSGNWYETLYRGRTAYVSAEEKYTELFELPLEGEGVEKVIAAGHKLLGTPYVYGATRLHDGAGNKLKYFTTERFDCSSLMQYIFYEGAGTLLDMTTRTQIKQGTHIDKTEIKRGDLLFFTNASRKYLSGIERVGHVALYLGENYILHTASDYAKIEQISMTRWSYFIEARRVL